MAIGKIKVQEVTPAVKTETPKSNKFAKVNIGDKHIDKKVVTHSDLQISLAQKEVETKVEQGNMELVPLDSIVEIEIDNIIMHNRTTFSQDELKKFAKAISKNIGKGVLGTGLLHPIIVRKKEGEEGVYERITGYRRALAFMLNGEEFIPAVIIDADNKTARGIRHSENAHREKLNDYDELISILEELSYAADVDISKIISIIKSSNSHFDRTKSLQFRDTDLEVLNIIEAKLNDISEYKIKAMPKRLNILDMNPLILEEMKKNLITFSNANEIHRAKLPDKDVKALLLFNSETNPTTIEFKLKIAEIKQSEKVAKKQPNPLVTTKTEIMSLKVGNFNKLGDEEKEKATVLLNDIIYKLSLFKLIVND